MVTAPHAPVPFSPALEDLYIPSPDKIEAAVRDVMGAGKAGRRIAIRRKKRRRRPAGRRRIVSADRERRTMSDIETIVMPKWGLAMQEGMVAKWHVAEGARRSGRARRSSTSRPRRSPTSSRARSTARCAGWSSARARRCRSALPHRGRGRRALGRRRRASTPSSPTFQANFVGRGCRRRAAPEPEDIETAAGRIRYPAARATAPAPRSSSSTASVVTSTTGCSTRKSWRRATPPTPSTCPATAARPRSVGAGDVASLAKAVLAFMDAKGIKKAHLVGHSMGGAIALDAGPRCHRTGSRASPPCRPAGLGARHQHGLHQRLHQPRSGRRSCGRCWRCWSRIPR